MIQSTCCSQSNRFYQVLSLLKVLFNVETFVKFQKSGLELLKNLANAFVQKSAKTNFTPFSHLSALRVSPSLNFTAALCYLPCFVKKGLCFVEVFTNPRVPVCLQQLIIN
jgi:hypothetical protein